MFAQNKTSKNNMMMCCMDGMMCMASVISVQQDKCFSLNRWNRATRM